MAQCAALVRRKVQANMTGIGISAGMALGQALPNPATAVAVFTMVGACSALLLTEWVFSTS